MNQSLFGWMDTVYIRMAYRKYNMDGLNDLADEITLPLSVTETEPTVHCQQKGPLTRH